MMQQLIFFLPDVQAYSMFVNLFLNTHFVYFINTIFKSIIFVVETGNIHHILYTNIFYVILLQFQNYFQGKTCLISTGP